MDDSIVIATLGNYWLKTKFKICIVTPADSSAITGTRYRELVIEAINEWKSVLDNFANENQTHSRLRNIEFEIIDDCTDADIRIKWWHSNPNNGMTRFNPHLGSITFSEIFIAKHQGPDLPTVNHPVPPNSIPTVIRTEDEIRSVAKHELGHALGLGHCSYPRDLMYTGDIRPNTRREFSRLDLEVLSQKFSIIEDSTKPISVTHFIPKDEWESAEK